MEMAFGEYLDREFGKKAMGCQIKRNHSNVTSCLGAALERDDGWTAEAEIVSPRGWGEFELRLSDIKRRVGIS
ncbi:hypothetical protein [Eubacterium aggregans]|uniref:hypothetical protein n=1 Tax=Eubacterium aggregans TaxID=81409 RepID=UPI000B7C5FE1|nr:hypothetical protein [Eubacterium aggregans]